MVLERPVDAIVHVTAQQQRPGIHKDAGALV
jgi:hypothetical protein